MTLTITLRAAKQAGACTQSYSAVRRALGRGWSLDQPLPLLRILEIRGISDMVWALRCTPAEQAEEKRRVLSLWLADVLEHIQHRMKDERSRAVILLLREHVATPVSAGRWVQARDAAYAAYAYADVGGGGDAYAAHAAHAAACAAAAHVFASAYASAAYACAAYAFAYTYASGVGVADADAVNSEREWQTERLRYYLEGEDSQAHATIAKAKGE